MVGWGVGQKIENGHHWWDLQSRLVYTYQSSHVCGTYEISIGSTYRSELNFQKSDSLSKKNRKIPITPRRSASIFRRPRLFGGYIGAVVYFQKFFRGVFKFLMSFDKAYLFLLALKYRIKGFFFLVLEGLNPEPPRSPVNTPLYRGIHASYVLANIFVYKPKGEKSLYTRK